MFILWKKASTVSPLGYFGCVWIPSLIGTNNALFVDLSQRLLCTLLEDDRYEVEQFSGGTVLVEGDWCDLCRMLLMLDNIKCTQPLSFLRSRIPPTHMEPFLAEPW